MVTYTIAVCNYNMAETIERSLRSILDQIDDRFEVLVIDDGSTDGSIRIIQNLIQESDQLRLIVSNNQNIGEARQDAINHAAGEYVLPQLDADDVYDPVIPDFVELYHQIESKLGRSFFLKGRSLNMAPTELLESIPYRSLGYGEDKDLWRRLFAADAVVWIDHESPCRTIGYNRNLLSRIEVTYKISKVQFQSGVTFGSFVKDRLLNHSLRSFIQALMSPLAYADAVRQGRLDLPKGYEQYGRLKRKIASESVNVEEIEQKFDIEIDHSAFSETGQEILFSKPT